MPSITKFLRDISKIWTFAQKLTGLLHEKSTDWKVYSSNEYLLFFKKINKIFFTLLVPFIVKCIGIDILNNGGGVMAAFHNPSVVKLNLIEQFSAINYKIYKVA